MFHDNIYYRITYNALFMEPIFPHKHILQYPNAFCAKKQTSLHFLSSKFRLSFFFQHEVPFICMCKYIHILYILLTVTVFPPKSIVKIDWLPLHSFPYTIYGPSWNKYPYLKSLTHFQQQPHTEKKKRNENDTMRIFRAPFFVSFVPKERNMKYIS